MTESTAEVRGRGRPRSEKAQKAILAAAIDLLLEQGLHAMSMDAVAGRAGVSKATGSLRGDLLARLRPWLRLLRDKPYGRVVAGLVATAQADAEFAELYLERFVRPRRDAMRPILLRAIDRGEIPRNVDLEIALDLIYGPIYHRMLHGHAPLDERFARNVVDTILAGIAPGL
jgi:AcrR family transcriptional regulator